MAQEHTIAVLEGDGIGPEITAEAVKALRAVESRSGVRFHLRYAPFGGRAYFETGASFPPETQTVCDEADAIIKGPIGLSHDESKKIPTHQQPERGALLPCANATTPSPTSGPSISRRNSSTFPRSSPKWWATESTS